MDTLEITYRDPGDLTPRDTNPRTHSKKQIRQIADSITAFGFNNPVLIDAQDGIVAGHGRVAAAKLLGLNSVPTVCLDNLTPAQIKAYVIADNRLAELAGWDEGLLAIEFEALIQLEAETGIDLDLAVTGFDTPQIDLLLTKNGAQDEDADSDDPDDTVLIAEGPAITRLGDLWQVGPHRLYCGDALAEASYTVLLAGERAGMVFTDPPYNVPIGGHVSGLGKHQHREFAMATGEMSEAAFTGFLTTVLTHLARFSADGSLHFVCMDWRHLGEVLAAGRSAYDALKNLCVWVKSNGGMGSLYRSQHEFVFIFKAGTARHINNVELGRHGRYRTNVWQYAGANSFGGERDDDLARHPTAKPVQLVTDAILDCSNLGDIVLDVFTGGGSTLVAAHRAKRRGYGLELDPLYCDAVVRRLQQAVGAEARLLATGETFDGVAARRLNDAEPAPAAAEADPGNPDDTVMDWADHDGGYGQFAGLNTDVMEARDA